jgi:DNA-binding beta-propeller fold protein YncE
MLSSLRPQFIADRIRMRSNPVIEFDVSADSLQTLAMPGGLHRSEGIGYSASGNIIAIATSDTNTVFLFRRRADGQFETTPYWSLSGPESRLAYPHDVSFAPSGQYELLAVAQRGGSIAIYQKGMANENYGPEPVFEICGPKTRLKYSDGVAFVPPDYDHIAACNLETGRISFYRKTSSSPLCFDLQPVFELRHRSLADPDGLAFSQCGQWLAVANHGNHSVSIFLRRHRSGSRDKLEYGPRPVTVIKDPRLRHPHSVAFSPETNHLVVTNSGANYISVYAPTMGFLNTRWSQSPTAQKIVGPDALFQTVNARNKMEGKPKGIAIHQNSLAICSPEHGVKIYSYRPRNPEPNSPVYHSTST